MNNRVQWIALHILSIICSLIGVVILWKGLNLPEVVTIFDLFFKSYPYLLGGLAFYYLGQVCNLFIAYQLCCWHYPYSRLIVVQIALFEAGIFIMVLVYIFQYLKNTFW